MRAIVPSRPLRHLPLIWLAAPVLMVGLAACEPQAPGGATAPPPADAPDAPANPLAAFEGEIRAVGTEPFWGLRISETEITLERMDHPSSKRPNPGPTLDGERAIWRTPTPDGDELVVTLWEEACSDGMSDLTYVYQARVQVGDETLSGCAGKADAMPREGG
jgi:uncharacterized membrane protein